MGGRTSPGHSSPGPLLGSQPTEWCLLWTGLCSHSSLHRFHIEWCHMWHPARLCVRAVGTMNWAENFPLLKERRIQCKFCDEFGWRLLKLLLFFFFCIPLLWIKAVAYIKSNGKPSPAERKVNSVRIMWWIWLMFVESVAVLLRIKAVTYTKRKFSPFEKKVIQCEYCYESGWCLLKLLFFLILLSMDWSSSLYVWIVCATVFYSSATWASTFHLQVLT